MGAGVPSCFEPGWCLSFVTSHFEMHVYFCLFVNIASLIVQQCTCTYASDQCELDNLGIQMGPNRPVSAELRVYTHLHAYLIPGQHTKAVGGLLGGFLGLRLVSA